MSAPNQHSGHLDAELDQPQDLATDRLADIARECLQRWDGFPTIPGSRRWSVNGRRALYELERRVSNLEEQYQTALDRLWEAHDQLCGCDKPADEGRCSAPEETWGAFEYLGERERVSSPALNRGGIPAEGDPESQGQPQAASGSPSIPATSSGAAGASTPPDSLLPGRESVAAPDPASERQ